LRELAPQVLGSVARRFRDFSSAEDAVQEATIAAFAQWPQEGVPENPRGCLIQVRSEIARRQQETAVAKGCGDHGTRHGSR
jgi:predicted RNA polymerase sigma factor